MTDDPWWRDCVIYQLYVRSFADGNDDGVGDLLGVRERLDHIANLGVDGLWLTPFYVSPMADHGYDVANPRDVDPLFGDLAAFDELLADAHDRGLRVLVDVVPNHTSDRHPWFVEALGTAPGSPARERYLFRDGRGPDGSEPPNNWLSTFGGPAWTRVEDGQWYLHLFAPEQPDLNWRNPEVVADAERTLRFWLDRGVDGFRIDVAHGLFKDQALRDNPNTHVPQLLLGDEVRYAWDQPEVHDVYRQWRRVLDSYPGDRVAAGEVWVADTTRWAAYIRPDELHLSFTFSLTVAPWDCDEWRTAITEALAAVEAVEAPATWVLGNHDVPRVVSRYGSLDKARAALLATLALPGAYFLYQGDELGLPDVDVPVEQRQDPMWERTGTGRDACRAPLPWEHDSASFGFSTSTPWLPQGDDWDMLAVDVQLTDPLSTLVLTRGALAIRRGLPSLGDGPLVWRDVPDGPGCLAFDRSGDPHLTCVVNFDDDPVDLALPGRLVLASAPVSYDGATLTLPGSATVWLVLNEPSAGQN